MKAIAVKYFSFTLELFLKKKKLIISFAKILIAAGLLIFLINYLNPKQIFTAFQSANLILILSAFLLLPLNLFIQYKKWKLSTNYILNENNNRKVFTSLFYGFSAGIFTPARTGEYFGRAIAYKDQSFVRVSLATFLDKIFPLIVVFIFGIISSLLFLNIFYGLKFYLAVTLLFLIGLIIYSIYKIINSNKIKNSLFIKRILQSEKLYKYLVHFKTLKKLDNKFVKKVIQYSVLFHLCFILQFIILVAAFSHNTNYLNYFWSGNLIMFVKTAIPSISLGELGIREGASVFFLTRMGELQSSAFNASIFLFVINVLIPALIGFVLLPKKNDA